MCGPPPMIKFACKQNLDALGYDKKRQLALSSFPVLGKGSPRKFAGNGRVGGRRVGGVASVASEPVCVARR